MNLPINQIICGDCIEIMKNFPNDSIDCIITDIPYNLKKPFANDDLPPEQWTKFIQKISTILYSKSRENSFFITDFSRCYLPKLFPAILQYHYSDMVAAYAINTMRKGQFGLDQLNPSFVFKKGSPKVKERYSNVVKVLHYPKSHGILEHPTQKYVNGCRTWIRMFSKPNDIILDPFVGSGTSCLAAEMEGRRWIGIDISSEYCEIARKRIEVYKQKGNLDIFKGY